MDTYYSLPGLLALLASVGVRLDLSDPCEALGLRGELQEASDTHGRLFHTETVLAYFGVPFIEA